MTYIVPSIHPAVVIRSGQPITDVIAADIAKANRISLYGFQQPENIVVCLPDNPMGMEATVRGAMGWLQHWKAARCPVAIDVETSGLAFISCRLWSVALAGADGNNTSVAFTLHDLHTLPHEAERALVDESTAIMADTSITKIYQNSPYDRAVLAAKGYPCLGKTLDTLGLYHLVQSDSPRKDLGWIGHTYLDVEPWKLDENGNPMVFVRDMWKFLLYNAKDALNTMKLLDPLVREVTLRGNAHIIELQMAMADLATSMELVGLPVNVAKRRELGRALLAKIEQRRAFLRQALNWPDFNPMSQAHREMVYYDKRFLNLMPTAFTKKTKRPSTSYKNDAIIDVLENPIVRAIVDCQEFQSRFSNIYAEAGDVYPGVDSDGAFSRAMEQDGRIHCKWNPVGTAGSRFSSSPNGQNIMKGDKPFIAPVDGRVLVGADKCLAASTLIETVRGSIPIEQVVAGDRVYTLRDGKISWGEVTAQRHVGRLLSRKITLDTGVEVTASLDHRWPLHNGSTKRTDELVVGDRLVPFKRAEQAWGKNLRYVQLYSRSNRKYALEHHIVAEALLGPRPIDHFVHHKDGNGTNNTPENLEYKHKSQHSSEHASGAYWTYDHTLRKQRARESIATRRSYSGTGNPNYRGGTGGALQSVCLCCNESFRQYPSQNKKYCSAACYHSARGEGHNHKIIQVADCGEADCWAITVEPDHNYVLSAGVVTYNSQLELRIAACLAGVQELMTEMAKPDGDPHSLAAAAVWGPQFLAMGGKESKEGALLRDMVKNVVYAALYMAGVETVYHTVREKKQLDTALRAALDRTTVRRIIKGYFGKFIEFKMYHDRKYAHVEQTSTLTIPPFGRINVFPVHPAPYTEVANRDIQVCGSDIVGWQMCCIQEDLRRFQDAWIILHGHDQVVVECREADAESVKRLVEHHFGHYPLEGPLGIVDLSADVSIGKHLLAVK